MLGELATTNTARVAEYKARKTRYDQHTFRRDESEYAISEGWELVRENQNSDRYQKLKTHDEQLENEFWCLLYNFGYPNLNVGRNFQIEVTSNKRVTVPDIYKSAWIIDGQHRLYGYTELEEDERGSHLPFLAFENISIADETKIFADINSKQKSVSKKLLDEITGEIIRRNAPAGGRQEGPRYSRSSAPLRNKTVARGVWRQRQLSHPCG
jgi:hypothetical protein